MKTIRAFARHRPLRWGCGRRSGARSAASKLSRPAGRRTARTTGWSSWNRRRSAWNGLAATDRPVAEGSRELSHHLGHLVQALDRTRIRAGGRQASGELSEVKSYLLCHLRKRSHIDLCSHDA
jgi:hypothetical protein